MILTLNLTLVDDNHTSAWWLSGCGAGVESKYAVAGEIAAKSNSPHIAAISNVRSSVPPVTS